MIENPAAFLGFENSTCESNATTFEIIPFGLEKTVTFGKGTRSGPAAIIEASQEVELFDMELACEPCSLFNFSTLKEPDIAELLEEALDQLSSLVSSSIDRRNIPLILGGEHSLTPAAVKTVAQQNDKVLIVQFDAHSDLRDGYLGQHNSHASAMRRCLDYPNVEIIGIGIRNMGIDEYEFLKTSNRVKLFPAMQTDWDSLIRELPELVQGKNVYITFDVDGLDPSIMPATGTPEPGGLDWVHTLKMLKAICSSGNIVGADIVELAPIANMHSPNFIAAQLAYKLMSYIAVQNPANLRD